MSVAFAVPKQVSVKSTHESSDGVFLTVDKGNATIVMARLVSICKGPCVPKHHKVHNQCNREKDRQVMKGNRYPDMFAKSCQQALHVLLQSQPKSPKVTALIPYVVELSEDV